MTTPVNQPSQGSRRPYRSTLRAEQARLTRRNILDAAEQLFLSDGYGATTITAIAAAADVSVDTVYTAFGSKRGVLTTLMDVRVAGDDSPVALLDRGQPEALAAEPDPRQRARLVAEGITDVHERARRIDDLMLSAAGSDPEIAALRTDVQQRQRLEGMRRTVRALTASGQLRAGLDEKHATDILWTIAGPDVHRLLRSQRDWTADVYRDWLADSITRLLLGL